MRININISSQQLVLYDDSGNIVRVYPISTARRGVGEESGSLCTPRGNHIVRAKIGAEQPVNTVFVGRRSAGQIYSAEMGREMPDRDWILSRILWLSGCEPGINRLGSCDTMRRYIYIHGCPDEDVFDRPSSHGCIKLHNPDMLALFRRVAAGTRVLITE